MGNPLAAISRLNFVISKTTAEDTPELGEGPDLSAPAVTPSLLRQRSNNDKPSLCYKPPAGACI